MGGSQPIEGGIPIDITLPGVQVAGQPETWPIDITPPHPLMTEEDLPADLPTTSGKWPSRSELMDLFMGGSMPIEGGIPIDITQPGVQVQDQPETWPIDITPPHPIMTAADIFPGWLTGADSTMPADFKLYLPLVPNQAALDEALGKQPEQISTRILDRIGSGLEGGASLLNPLVNAWGIDLSDDGLKQLDPLADRVSNWFNDRLFGNLGKPDGDFVGAIVAKVLEALTAE